MIPIDEYEYSAYNPSNQKPQPHAAKREKTGTRMFDPVMTVRHVSILFCLYPLTSPGYDGVS